MSNAYAASERLWRPSSASLLPFAVGVIGIAKLVLPLAAPHPFAAIETAAFHHKTERPSSGAIAPGVRFDILASVGVPSLGLCRMPSSSLSALGPYRRHDHLVPRDLEAAFAKATHDVSAFDLARLRHRDRRHATLWDHRMSHHRQSFRFRFDDLAIAGIEREETTSLQADMAAPITPATGKERNGQAITHPLFSADATLGRFDTSARAVALNGQAAAALSIGFDPGIDGLKLKASGAAEMTAMSDLTTLRHTFKVSTVASLPLD